MVLVIFVEDPNHCLKKGKRINADVESKVGDGGGLLGI